MNLLKNFWSDEAGLVMSAELVMLGTVGVLGATVGLSAASTAINDEMVEFSQAIRSLDQSYHIEGHKSCRAWTASSSYRQQDVAVSLADLCGQIEEAEGTVDKRSNLKRQAPPKSKELRKKMEAKKKKNKAKKKKNEA
ncbi:hypothetical protein [Gimesia maris]|jgi:hypothetical protein|uniref:Uncharacterized protein n=1 Tax=Gimesia maris TaxID=122 RepID=A0ABX5YGS2_9PLAN|nr:hypothetical protein [Gimesia maris]HAW28679.1 hypothetical protein [Planctomycetaceae bacterium]EDL57583.1 hypothetical protein PM8797T_06045 [Gimesia maris DSM 8797]QDU12846.1 hypothetical protein CA11_06270 [Gimesia maris]QEG14779.1 hypothetical protein GmarT_06160 [Gimesia maris]QGQ31830.1 hypothetical protein F1729_26120 [Gimesia maris]|tara:strand:- start:26 stop:439 length:414 start_codon:yes stop_codon:yes gene_type:complete